jgi:hypothetical protein
MIVHLMKPLFQRGVVIENRIEETLLPHGSFPVTHHFPLPAESTFDLLDDAGDTYIWGCSHQEMNVILHYRIAEQLKLQLGFVVPQCVEEKGTGLWVSE